MGEARKYDVYVWKLLNEREFDYVCSVNGGGIGEQVWLVKY